MTDELRDKRVPDQGYPDPSVHTPVGFDTGDPYASMNAANYKHIMDAAALKQSQIDAETQRQASAVFWQGWAQQNALNAASLSESRLTFATHLQTITNGMVIGEKVVDVSPQEVAQDTISARQARDLGEEVTRLLGQVEALKASIDGVTK